MKAYSKRAYPRSYYEAPIRYARIDSDGIFQDSRMYNYSRGGIYFEPDRPLVPESKIAVVMMNYSPGAFGPESWQSYTAKVRWCKEIPKIDMRLFGVGIEFLTKSRDIYEAELRETQVACDLCGEYEKPDAITQTEEFFNLCGHCLKHMNSMPPGTIKESIYRFLSGNVV